MALFKLRLDEQMRKRAKIAGRCITQLEVAKQTELSYPTIQKWVRGATINQLDADTVDALMSYFECGLADLVTIVREGEPSP